MKTLILTDNLQGYYLAHELKNTYGNIDICQSPSSSFQNVSKVNVKEKLLEIIKSYNLVISIHCKQIFPPELVCGIRCINVHPGFNPYNRGWFPQVFSIINGLPSGVTIHEMDEQLDHGPIICQKEYKIKPWDTSGSAYNKIMEIERDLMLEHFESIRDRTYETIISYNQGNINYKRDFEQLKEIDLNRKSTFRDFINILRALTHNDFRNAYFKDSAGRKIFIKILLEPEDLQCEDF